MMTLADHLTMESLARGLDLPLSYRLLSSF